MDQSARASGADDRLVVVNLLGCVRDVLGRYPKVRCGSFAVTDSRAKLHARGKVAPIGACHLSANPGKDLLLLRLIAAR